MELLALAILWPLIILVVGFVFVSVEDVAAAFLFFIFIFLLAMIFGTKGRLGISGATKKESEQDMLERTRRAMISFSIALLLPIFMRYLLQVSENSLLMMIIGLVLSFGLIIWGMFVKNNKVLMLANTIGGGLSVIYLYFEIWSLGQFAQIVATALGLVIAIAISVIKFREKLK